ncbi:MAG TPA: hypothetical protein VNU68_11450 [Verrucomicrobiae bacterium]|nr:hypothetical protein [Verrucomicrobiae bacterium]
MPEQRQPQVVQGTRRRGAVRTVDLLVNGQRRALHFFRSIKIADFQVDPAEQTAQIRLDFGLIGQFVAEAFGGAIENCAQHGGVLPTGNGRVDALQHFFEEPGNELALGRFTAGFALAAFCLEQRILGFAVRLALVGQRCRNDDQTCDEQCCDQGNAPEQQFIAEDDLFEFIEPAG